MVAVPSAPPRLPAVPGSLASSARLETLVLLRVPASIHFTSHPTVCVFQGHSRSHLQFTDSGLSVAFRPLSRPSLPGYPPPPPALPSLTFTWLPSFHCAVTSSVQFSVDSQHSARPLACSRHTECVCCFNAHN